MQSLFCLSLGDFSPAMQMGRHPQQQQRSSYPLASLPPPPCWHADSAAYCNLARRLSSGRQSSASCCHPCWLFALSAINCCLNSAAFRFAFRFSNLNVSFVFRISISIFQCVHAGNNCEIKMFTSLVCFICYLPFDICCLALWSNLAMWQDKSSSRVSD